MMTDTSIPQGIPTGMPLSMFRYAIFHSRLHQLWAKLTRRCFCLRDLDEELECSQVVASHYAGIKTVSIDRIQGTQGKADEFDAEFNPTQERSRNRWISIAFEKLHGRDLPPVELVQIDNTYYVRDGHHRISVSRSMGQSFIDAEVTVMRLHQHNCLR